MVSEDLFILRIRSADPLERAFAQLMDAPDVTSCVIEPDSMQIRFVAPVSIARDLIERIYLDGGLVWSSRHPLTADPPKV